MILKILVIAAILYLYYMIFVSGYYMCPYYKGKLYNRGMCKKCPSLKKSEESLHDMNSPVHEDPEDLEPVWFTHTVCDECDKFVFIEFTYGPPPDPQDWWKRNSDRFCKCNEEK